MKKSFLLLVIVFNLIGCSLFQVKPEYEDPRLKEFTKYYQNWKLEKAKSELDKLKMGNPLDKSLIKKIQNKHKDIKLRKKQKNRLQELLNIMQQAMKKNDFKTIEEHIKSNLINKIKLNQLKKYDLSNINIFIGDIKFYKKTAETIIIFNYIDQSTYYNFEFILKDGKWILEHYEERG